MRNRELFHNEGSAYIVALLVLVVLTLVGLSLSLITQTELEIGSAERTIQRVFYSAESGVASTVAKALTEADYGSRSYRFEERNAVGVVRLANFRSDTEVSQFVPIIDPPCNLCEINDAGTYSDDSYKKVTFGVESAARRQNEGSTAILAQKVIDTNVDVQPWKLTTEAQLTAIESNQGTIGE